jgi:hypothetical protein
MKNTKKYLSAGVALAIALFASVQVAAMNVRERIINLDDQIAAQNTMISALERNLNAAINPNLTARDRQELRAEINQYIARKRALESERARLIGPRQQ